MAALFKKISSTKKSFGTIEELFGSLKKQGKIENLWLHQGDILRSYESGHLTSRDVALELPTGSGKTLIGLLIGEFRRLTLGERTIYVCPTRQLAKQAGKHAVKYGVKAHVLVGMQAKYSQAALSEYRRGEAIAVTTISGIFNINPALSDGQCIIFDDAHACENYISSNWSVELTWRDNKEALLAISELLSEGLPNLLQGRFGRDLEDGAPPSNVVEMIPTRFIRKYESAISDIMEASLEEKTSPWFKWQNIKGHLKACNLFITEGELQIRPIVAPTHTHAAFSDAVQRVYMSATLGLGGELERITGVNKIDRIPLPPGREKRGSGRRLILFPELAMERDDIYSSVSSLIQQLDRALVISPSNRDDSDLIDFLEERGIQVLKAVDVEADMTVFTNSVGSALRLHRYDGIDLPGPDCRFLVFAGLPSGANLQERFLWSRVQAQSLLRDRILTRFVQGIGRCTRSDSDYAMILVLGQKFTDFIFRAENRSLLLPEIQAEIEFGVRNSSELDAEMINDFYNAFSNPEDTNWESAEEQIANYRDDVVRRDDPIAITLSEAAQKEIVYAKSLWKDDIEKALETASKIAEILDNESLKGYRSWWHYLASECALSLYESTSSESYVRTAKKHLKKAVGNSASNLYARLGRDLDWSQETIATDKSPLATGIASAVCELGFYGKKFERSVQKAREGILGKDSDDFHRGLKFIGNALGFAAEVPNMSSDPDCIWSLPGECHITFEVKSNQSSEDPIGANDVSQAARHLQWLKANRYVADHERLYSVLVSPRTTLAEDSLPFVNGVLYINTSEIQNWMNPAVNVLREVRAQCAGDPSKAEDFAEKFISDEMRDPNTLFDPSKSVLPLRPLADLKKS